MPSRSAEANLAAIRTLMERSALYRRAVAPLQVLAGVVGVTGALFGVALDMKDPRQTVMFWMFTGLVVGTFALVLVRRQALGAGERFWTPPARRVLQAVCPGFAAGAILAVPTLSDRPMGKAMAELVPALWMVCYGLSMHAAAFFLPRGPQLLAWLFIATGAALGLAFAFSWWKPKPSDFHWCMGTAFGGYHLVSGVVLRWAEKRDPDLVS
ncbi:MAG: hypothetical protein FJ404_07675 [Verrucomicrobia bacterium]|nr:hypothetical protein [Verrucomicrobiota bacterium]